MDYTIQKPDGENSFNSIIPLGAGYLSFEIQTCLRLTNLLQLETGYRFKQHAISYKNEFLLSSQWVETTHSVPLRIGVMPDLKNHGFLNRFSIGLSCGILFDFMQQSESRPLVTSQPFQMQTSSGVYNLKDDYNPNEVNKVKSAISFDGDIKASYRLHKFICVCLGYGYTHGTRTLAKGNYTIQGPSGVVEKGAMTSKGVYRFWMLGFTFHLFNKSEVEH